MNTGFFAFDELCIFVITLLQRITRLQDGKIIMLVIREKGESQNGCFKKSKHAKISEKQTFLTPDTHTYVACFAFLKHPF